METVRRMRRAERREQILGAATRAFASRGYAATSLDDVAAEAGISRVILYRHFESKNELYRAILERACTLLAERVGSAGYSDRTIPALVRAAGEDPDGFRLLFRYAAREPEFRDFVDVFTTESIEIARRNLAARIPDPAWLGWAAQLTFAATIEGVIAWLDNGMPDPETAAERISMALRGVIEAASHSQE
ncbi:TetR/AcrR family transcriptional regulator [Nonomuraea sediminis]|uniref:TetR/AcrR family transcriptional regulator n=1 Tax=Nonomuraea sediminis TaxID=2835864 RepID=UPI001BDD574D|nr:TetR/AcrR family transcriptional regulator [Nonomuraea sediminis]